MNYQLQTYISFARSKQLSDKDIHDNLVSAGWDAAQVAAALLGDVNTLMPPPPPGQAPVTAYGGAPIAVVQRRSTRGFEYVIMFLALAITAASFGQIVHNLINAALGLDGGFGAEAGAAATAGLIVGLPIFSLLFLRLKKAEHRDPSIRTDSSRHGAVQFALIVSFIWGIGKLLVYIYALLNGSAGYGEAANPLAELLHALVTVVIAGGIFAYYWIDEHRKDVQ